MLQLQMLTLVFLLISFISVWSSRKIKSLSLWLYPFAIALLLGLLSEAITLLSLCWIFIALLGLFSLKKWDFAGLSSWLLFPLGIFVLAMGMNLLPGFNSISIITPQLLGNSVHPFSLEYRLAKPIAGLFVLAFLSQRCTSIAEVLNSLKPINRWVVPTLVVLAVGAVLGLAVDIKFLLWTPVFVVCNVFLSVIPEEAFFRGFMQQPLQNRFGKALWIVPLMGVLFALVHTPPPYINPVKFYIVIGLAGTCYAWAYSLKDRIELSIASHSLLNILHFIFFAYPLAF